MKEFQRRHPDYLTVQMYTQPPLKLLAKYSKKNKNSQRTVSTATSLAAKGGRKIVISLTVTFNR
jgi:hypothetical protein